MKHTIRIAMVIAGFFAFHTQADVSLTLELNGPDMQAQTKKVSLARFFVRVDDAAEPGRFLLYQTGKFFPLYQVDETAKTYTLLTPEVKPTLKAGNNTVSQSSQQKAKPIPEKTDDNSSPSSGSEQKAQTGEKSTVEKPAQTTSKTKLRLTKKKKTIAGIRCRVVEEIMGDQTVMTHCMADKARLGITEREIRSLARLFKMARERNLGWLGTYTKDEDFVSIASEDHQSKKTLRLTAFDTKPLPAGYLRIPKHYKLTSP
ncbi:MAG: hypothetical protein QNJ78_05995 [Gammaproteobacteria bacterium]|nr:hypothetical protein [Gammaproteobacteria bacterium]